MVVHFSFNTWPILVSALATVVLGFLWYGPLFGKPWMKLMGITPKQAEAYKKSGKSMSGSYVIMVLTTLISVTVVGMFLKSTGGAGAWDGFVVGFLCWLFIGTYSIGSVLWEGRPWKLWFLNNSYYFLTYIITGTILGAWM